METYKGKFVLEDPVYIYISHITSFTMRFLESLVAATTVCLVPFANGTASETADWYCQALVQVRNSRCVDGLCTFGNAMTPKYSCSQSVIDEATRIYEENVGGIRNHDPDLDSLFPEEYSDFLGRCNMEYIIYEYLRDNPAQMRVLF